MSRATCDPGYRLSSSAISSDLYADSSSEFGNVTS
jgi:hypothetical protein